MREVITTSILQRFDQMFLRGGLRSSSVILDWGKNLKFYTSVAKWLKVKVRMFWGLIPTFVEVTGEKLVGSPSWIGLMTYLYATYLYCSF